VLFCSIQIDLKIAVIQKQNEFYYGVTTCLVKLELSGILTAVRKMSGILLNIREVSGKNLVREKWPKTVYC